MRLQRRVRRKKKERKKKERGTKARKHGILEACVCFFTNSKQKSEAHVRSPRGRTRYARAAARSSLRRASDFGLRQQREGGGRAIFSRHFQSPAPLGTNLVPHLIHVQIPPIKSKIPLTKQLFFFGKI